MDSNPHLLSQTAEALITDPSNQLHLSVVSLWEIAIKTKLGKLILRVPISTMVGENERTNGLEVLPVSPSHVYELEQLPLVHNDPFDRMLVSVANCEQATLVSADAVLQQYPVSLQW